MTRTNTTWLKRFFVFTDLGFVAYWLITFLQLVPNDLMFKDYNDPILMAWNWSFFPLDMLVSATGFLSLWLHARQHAAWSGVALLSLAFTMVAGLNAVAFWWLRQDFEVLWWLPNLYLLVYPLFFVPRLLQQLSRQSNAGPGVVV